MSDLKDAMNYQLVATAEHTFGHQFVDFAKTLHNVFDEVDKTVNRQFCTKLSGNWTAVCLVCVGPSELVAKDLDFSTSATPRDELRDIVKRINEEINRCHKRDGEISQELLDAVYEARAAIGEDRP